MRNTFLIVCIALIALNLNFVSAYANQSYSPDSWSNGIGDSALSSLPDADEPFVLQSGPFKNRDIGRTMIFGLASEVGIPGYFHMIRGAYESPKDNLLYVRVGKFATAELAEEAKMRVQKNKYPYLRVENTYSNSDDLKGVVMLDIVYDEFDEGSNYTGRFVISCTPQVPDSVQRFIKVSEDGMEVTVPIHMDRISSNANEAIKRVRNQQSHQLVKDVEIRFDEQFGCDVIVIKTKRKIRLSSIRQFSPVLVNDLEKIPN